MQHVWVLRTGTANEGSEIVGLFETKAGARAPFLNQVSGLPFNLSDLQTFEDHDWSEDRHDEIVFSSGSDYVELTRFGIRK